MGSPIEGGDLITIVEIDQDLCQETYGTGNCTASLSADNPDKCRNTPATCQDTANYDPGTLTISSIMEQTNYPIDNGTYYLPHLKSVSTEPSRLNTSSRKRNEPFGQRASCKVTYTDHPHTDRYVDPYAEERLSGAAQFSGEGYDPFERGTFWGKWIARNPYHLGRAMRVKQGVIRDGDLSTLTTRNYIIERVDGPDTKGNVSITGKDPLKLADDDRAQAPRKSLGSIENSGGINDSATSITLTTGSGDASYGASGYAVINREIVSYTRSSDTLTLTRGQLGTTAASHAEGDLVQEVLVYSDDAAAILYDLLTEYADIPAGFITQDDWDNEVANHFQFTLNRTLVEPTSVSKLVGQICEEAGISLWWDEIAQKIRLSVIKTLAPGAITFTDDNIRAGSLSVKARPDARISQVWTNYNYNDPFDDNKPSSTRVTIDSAAGGATQYGQEAIRKIDGYWIDNSALADNLNDRLLARFRDLLREVEFQIPSYRADEVAMGQNHKISTRYIQDANGDNLTMTFRILSLEQDKDWLKIRGEEVKSFATLDPNTRIVPLESGDDGLTFKQLWDKTYPTPPTSSMDITFVVEAGVEIGSPDTSIPALTADMEGYDYNSLTLEVYGTLSGRGGAGGIGELRASGNEADGEDGGTGLKVVDAIDLENYGTIQGGGGGGAGGDRVSAKYIFDGGGGGGGAGKPGGAGGRPGDNTAQWGASGSINGFGSGGSGAGGIGESGGAGGTPGDAGGSTGAGSGGSGGPAIDGISLVNVVESGTIDGAQIN